MDCGLRITHTDHGSLMKSLWTDCGLRIMDAWRGPLTRIPDYGLGITDSAHTLRIPSMLLTYSTHIPSILYPYSMIISCVQQYSISLILQPYSAIGIHNPSEIDPYFINTPFEFHPYFHHYTSIFVPYSTSISSIFHIYWVPR